MNDISFEHAGHEFTLREVIRPWMWEQVDGKRKKTMWVAFKDGECVHTAPTLKSLEKCIRDNWFPAQ